MKATILNEGDLLGNVYLEVLLTGTTGTAGKYTVNHFSNSLLKSVELMIGGFSIDKHYGVWYQINEELENNENNSLQYISDSTNGGKFTTIDYTSNDSSQRLQNITNRERLTGNSPMIFGGDNNGQGATTGTFKKKFYIPLKFWFNKNEGQYLPLIALTKHQVDLMFDFSSLNTVIGNSSDLSNLSLEFKLFGEFYVNNVNFFSVVFSCYGVDKVTWFASLNVFTVVFVNFIR